MGCDYSKRMSQEPENAICHAETLSGFDQVDLNTVDYVIIKYAPEPVLSEAQVLKICEKLHLAKINTLGVYMSDFFEAAKLGEMYRRDYLYVAGILLTKGRWKEKCKFLHWYFSSREQDSISWEALEQLYQTTLKVAIFLSPKLVPTPFRNSEEFLNYVKSLEKRESTTLAVLLARTMGRKSATNLQELVSALSGNMANIMTPHGLRVFALEQEIAVASPVKLPSERKTKKARFSDALEIGPEQSQQTPRRPILKHLQIACGEARQ